jgi:hypothetical protein
LCIASYGTCACRFNEAGPAGPATFEAGVAGYEARAFRGLGIFTSTPVRPPPSLPPRRARRPRPAPAAPRAHWLLALPRSTRFPTARACASNA